ncbi:integrase/recombinase, partial [mine drainage metagenome]
MLRASLLDTSAMTSEQEPVRDLATIVVPQVGRLIETGDPWQPHRLVDADGTTVEAVSAWFAELLAAGRSVATLRSYGMDLLRWLRFLSALGIPWYRATRSEARDFSRWLQVAGKPSRPHWRHLDKPAAPV